MSFNWENIIGTWLLIAVTSMSSIGVYSLFQSHKVTHYYITSDNNRDGDHELSITGNIEWGEDEELILDRNITYEEAIKLCSEMNKKLRR